MKDTKYRNTRETGLNWLADKLPDSLGGTVVKEKKKRKKKIERVYKKMKY